MDPKTLKATTKSTFSPVIILRGLELTIVGVIRAVQNPKFWSAETFKQAIIAIILSIALSIILQAPINIVRFFLFGVRQVVDIQSVKWDDSILKTLSFIEKKVLQLPIILMSALQHASPALDNMFMMSLQWVDITYQQKHKNDDPVTLRPMYYNNLKKYPIGAPRNRKTKGDLPPKAAWESFLKVMNGYIKRYSKRIAVGLGVYVVSQEPHIGKYALTGFTAYNMWKTIGPYPAGVILVASQFVPRAWTMVFFQGLLQSRTLMRELLEPYFRRVRFTPEEKKIWFRDRQGLLFGFGFGFYLFLQIPYFGVLIYGLAEASTALLITKITSPPPPPEESAGFAESQLSWQYKDTLSFLQYIPEWMNKGEEKLREAKLKNRKLKQ